MRLEENELEGKDFLRSELRRDVCKRCNWHDLGGCKFVLASNDHMLVVALHASLAYIMQLRICKLVFTQG